MFKDINSAIMTENNFKDKRDITTLSFIAEWFDPHPQITKRYLLKYHPATNEVEMKEVHSGRKFLKRTKIDDCQTPACLSNASLPSQQSHLQSQSQSQRDFFVGATICIFSRDLKLVDYGDNATRIALDDGLEKTVAIMLPNKQSLSLGRMLQTMEECGLTLVNMKGFRAGKEDVDIDGRLSALGLNIDQLSKEPDNDNFGGLYIALELRGINSLKIVANAAKERLSETGTSSFVAALNIADVELLQDTFLNKAISSTTATYDRHNTTCCIIKPHIIKSQSTGAILSSIMSFGYRINAIQLFHLDRRCAAEFYEVYDMSEIAPGHKSNNNVVRKDYNDMIDELVSGPALALEVMCNVMKFREEVAGPWDVEMAKNLYPNTIRAKFGVDRKKNAIHCTDLPEDNVGELAYFFSILAGVETKTSG